ncbi:hypothetical protein CRENBAI_003657 [Crenichthys baileyi]|uniref:Uncharacterized protein n=1 Tax=Crenichthys baileyi TaxID=28760 RepID=A0AAV9QZC8_9TELE
MCQLKSLSFILKVRTCAAVEPLERDWVCLLPEWWWFCWGAVCMLTGSMQNERVHWVRTRGMAYESHTPSTAVQCSQEGRLRNVTVIRDGLMDYLSAEISTSKQKKFSLVTFVDTPGLVDGDMIYPFDVNSAITWLGEQADLIFVFFDPMGQALCKRTLNIVEKLSEKCGDKLLFYLSKADEAGKETDRQRVMMQIVQELCRRPGLNKCGFEMPTIYIPNPQRPSRCVNQIDSVCQTIEKTINQAVQKTLDQLEKDSDLICSTISNKLEQDRADVAYNRSVRLHSVLCGALGVFLPFLFILSFIVSTFSKEQLNELLGEGPTQTVMVFTEIVIYLWEWIPEDKQVVFVISFGAFCYLLLFLAKYFAGRRNKTLTKKEKRKMMEHSDYIHDIVKTKKARLYEWYLQQCAAEQDL